MTDQRPAEVSDILLRLWNASKERMIAAGQDPLTIRDIADAVGTSRTAVYLWLRGDRFPRPSAIEKIAELFGQTAGEKHEIQSQLISALSARQRPAEEVPPPDFLLSNGIADRERFAAHLWIFKWQKLFRSGSDSFLFGELVKALSAPYSQSAPQFHYVFPSEAVAKELADLPPSKHSYDSNRQREDGRARASFFSLKRRLLVSIEGLDEERFNKTVCYHELSTLSDVLYLGIPRAEMLGYFAIEYNREGTIRFNREVDIFVEIDAQTEVADEPEEAGKDVDAPRTYWVSLPKQFCEPLWQDWKLLLDITHHQESNV